MVDKLVLEDAWARVRRARVHLEELQALVASVTDDPHSQQRAYPAIKSDEELTIEFLVVGLKPIPDVPLIFSDLIHNLRAALENAAMACYRRRGKLADPRDVTFPLVRDPARWERTVGKVLPGVDQRLIEQIRRFQPFSIENRPFDEKRAPRHPLVVLHDLARLDRHQRLHVARTTNDWGRVIFQARNAKQTGSETIGAIMEEGKVLARFTFQAIDPSRPFDALVTGHEMRVAIEIDSEGPVLSVAAWLLQFVEQVLGGLDATAASIDMG
ncbi:hypothetical protein [Nocardioides campestrisoli]|uniref:hypothetical protein n=1 Tax=Nocardioides campestrisoli TaxID=2736757 RepID=UPI0015E7A9AA|nr:hypothetical protein [Nocardioides campestrisoli]